MRFSLLQYVLLFGACVSMLGLGLSGFLVSRAQTRRDRREMRFASIVSPHLRAARTETAAFVAAPHADRRGPGQMLSVLFGYDPEKAELYPAPCWAVLAVALLLAWGTQAVAAGMMGPASLASLPIIWVLLCRGFFKWVERKRQKLMLAQFPDALSMIVRSVRVGVPVMEAVRAVSRELPGPTGPEFGRMIDQVAIGSTLEDAVVDLGRRSGLSEYRFFATALALQNQTGGTLSETLDSLADVIRKRAALRAKGYAMTSEARTSAMILAALPFVTGIMLYFLNPSYIMVLFTDSTGKQLLGGAVLSLSVGMLIIRMIIQKTLP
jgi:tight adherence protein B